VKDSEAIVALAGILAARGVGVWKPAGGYTAAETAIFYGPIGTTPDRAIGITRYGGSPDATYDGDPGPRLIQVRVRGLPGNPVSADDLADAVDAVLRRMTRTAGLSSAWASGPLPLGADGSRRTELSLNYAVTLED
jgi:hypothetical protein